MQLATDDGVSLDCSHGKRLGAALVTGGRRGIGRAICADLAARGFDVAFTDLHDDEGIEETRALVERSGRRSLFIRNDMTRIADHAALVEEVRDALGPITCLVNNAGVQVAVRGDLLDVQPAEFDRIFDTNLRGTFFLTQAVAKSMLGDLRPEGPRSIITITSANAHLVSPEKGAYGLSKIALSMAMQAFALRLAQAQIAVHEIRPGLIETDMTADVREHYAAGMRSGELCAMRRWGRPEDIAGAAGVLATGGMPYSTGDIYNVGGGMHIPRL